jgi:hypothetical protein
MKKNPTPGTAPEQHQAAILAQIRRLAASIGQSVALQPIEPQTPPDAGQGELFPDPQGQRRRVAPKPAAKAGPPKPRRFRLTERDYRILSALNAYRYLRTGQVHRLLFPECRTPQMARRRLRHLADPHYGYLRRIEPYVQVGQGSAETAWFLGRAGEEILRARGEKLLCYARDNSARVNHQFLSHALEISEFRLQLELALRHHPFVTLQRFIADFEMREHASATLGKKAFLLYHEVSVPAAPGRPAKTYIVYPDALIRLHGRPPFDRLRHLFFLEIDRGTESLPVLRDKVIGYDLFRRQRFAQKSGATEDFRVLLQTNSPRRAANIRQALVGLSGEELIWITDAARVTERSLLTGPIWIDANGQHRAILKALPNARPPATSNAPDPVSVPAAPQ